MREGEGKEEERLLIIREMEKAEKEAPKEYKIYYNYHNTNMSFNNQIRKFINPKFVHV